MLRHFPLIITVVLLAGCGTPSSDLHNAAQPDLKQLIQEQQQIARTVRITLASEKDTYRAGEEFEVRIRLNNPEQQTVDSVRTWIAFDPTKLEVLELHDETSDFDLTLAQENNFDNQQGLVSIGRSSQRPLSPADAVIHTIVFRVLPTTVEKITSLDFYGYQDGAQGYTGVYQVQAGKPFNLLQPPAIPGVKLKLIPQQ